VLIVNTNEDEFKSKLVLIEDKIIIDFVRLDDRLLDYENYVGINWSTKKNNNDTYFSSEDTVL
jgi:GDP-mannose 6-dehydrogenase